MERGWQNKDFLFDLITPYLEFLGSESFFYRLEIDSLLYCKACKRHICQIMRVIHLLFLRVTSCLYIAAHES